MGQLVFWIVVLLAACVSAWIVGVFATRAIRKRLLSDNPTESFTLQDLRELRDSGQISDTEHQAIRAALLGHKKYRSAVPKK